MIATSGPYPADVPADTLHSYVVAGLKPPSMTLVELDTCGTPPKGSGSHESG